MKPGRAVTKCFESFRVIGDLFRTCSEFVRLNNGFNYIGVSFLNAKFTLRLTF